MAVRGAVSPALALLLTLHVAGCAGTPGFSSIGEALSSATSGQPVAPAAPAVSDPANPGGDPEAVLASSVDEALGEAPASWSVPGGATEIYARIAGGLNRCHLGYGRDLAGTHMLFGETPPDSGRATIRIHQRSSENRHGLIAFVIELSTVGGETRVLSENKSFDRVRSRQIRAGAHAWSRNRTECEPLTSSELTIPGSTTAQPAPILVRKP